MLRKIFTDMSTFKTTARFCSVGFLAMKPLQICKIAPLHSLVRKRLTQIDTGTGPALGYGCRHLFSASLLGLDNYTSQRERTAIQFQNLMSKFRERMNEVLESDGKNMIFTEDLKNAIHIAESNEEDLSLVIGMAKKFNTQHSGLRFGAYVFGPVFMRMFHHLDQPESMLQALKMTELEGFFDQLASYQLAMDLLYEHGRYDDLLDVFEDLQGKRIHGVKYPKNCMTVALATLYKQNTQESYDRMMKMLNDIAEHGVTHSIRTIAFAASLALNQNNPHICLEIISSARSATHIAIRNLKVLSLTEVGRVEDTLPILRSLLQTDLPDTHQRNKAQICRETIDRVESAIMETENKELVAEFKHISKSLEANECINTDQRLDDLVCQPIEPFQPNNHGRRDRAMLAASFNRNSRYQKPRYEGNQRGRPGLRDME